MDFETMKMVVSSRLSGCRKGQVNAVGGLAAIAVALVVATLAAAFGSNIGQSVRSTMTENGTAYNATTDAMQGIANMTAQFGNIGTIGAAVVIIGLLVGGFYAYAGRR